MSSALEVFQMLEKHAQQKLSCSVAKQKQIVENEQLIQKQLRVAQAHEKSTSNSVLVQNLLRQRSLSQTLHHGCQLQKNQAKDEIAQRTKSLYQQHLRAKIFMQRQHQSQRKSGAKQASEAIDQFNHHPGQVFASQN